MGGDEPEDLEVLLRLRHGAVSWIESQRPGRQTMSATRMGLGIRFSSAKASATCCWSARQVGRQWRHGRGLAALQHAVHGREAQSRQSRQSAGNLLAVRLHPGVGLRQRLERGTQGGLIGRPGREAR